VEARGTRAKKSTFQSVARTAEEPGQALNVDLCFVPASHAAEVKLPAVSGSSGHLVVERPKDEAVRYPGRIFEDRSLDYAEAMQAFVTASAHRANQNRPPKAEKSFPGRPKSDGCARPKPNCDKLGGAFVSVTVRKTWPGRRFASNTSRKKWLSTR